MDSVLIDMTYIQLRRFAKKFGLKANQKGDKLRAGLGPFVDEIRSEVTPSLLVTSSPKELKQEEHLSDHNLSSSFKENEPPPGYKPGSGPFDLSSDPSWFEVTGEALSVITEDDSVLTNDDSPPPAHRTAPATSTTAAEQEESEVEVRLNRTYDLEEGGSCVSGSSPQVVVAAAILNSAVKCPKDKIPAATPGNTMKQKISRPSFLMSATKSSQAKTPLLPTGLPRTPLASSLETNHQTSTTKSATKLNRIPLRKSLSEQKRLSSPKVFPQQSAVSTAFSSNFLLSKSSLFSGTSSPTAAKTATAAPAKFNLKASLSRPVPYQPHHGPLRPFSPPPVNTSQWESRRRQFKRPPDLALTNQTARSQTRAVDRKAARSASQMTRRGLTAMR